MYLFGYKIHAVMCFSRIYSKNESWKAKALA